MSARRLRWTASQWLLNPGPPGVIGAAIGLWVALLPVGWLDTLRVVALVLSGVAVVWALVATFYSIGRRDRVERKRLAREAGQLAHDIYTVMQEYFSAEWDFKHARSMEDSTKASKQLDLARISIREQYFRLYGSQIAKFPRGPK